MGTRGRVRWIRYVDAKIRRGDSAEAGQGAALRLKRPQALGSVVDKRLMGRGTSDFHNMLEK